MKWRTWLVRIVFMLAFVALGVRLYAIQIDRNANYLQKAQAQSEASGTVEPLRGIIYTTDRNGAPTPIVLNKEYSMVYAVPIEIKDPQNAALQLAPIVNIDQPTLAAMLSKPRSQYSLLIEKADDDQVAQIQALGIKGIYTKSKLFRSYPFGTMAAQVLGFISPGSDGQLTGRYGIELQFNDRLEGVSGNPLNSSSQGTQNGQDVYLTIDRNIQNEAESIISDLLKEWHAKGASMIVQEPSTGKILAMASVPTFDPNNYSKYDIKDFLNPSVQLPYEPGSVFKIFTMSAGIDSGAVTPDTTYMDTGSIKIDKWTINDWDKKAHGLTTMTGVIEQSLNLGSIFAEKKTGNATFLDYVKRFGFGEKTGIELPGELRGNLLNLNGNSAINYATASFGQGITATPIQLITGFSAVANGGVLMKPFIISGTTPQVVRRVISQETDQKMVKMMVSAVDVNKVAAIPHYQIAAKTGTAYTTTFGQAGYNDSNVINSYIGFAPASRPQFTVMVKLDYPQNAPLAGQTVVPAFRTMVEFLLNYYNSAPDRN